ncbi:MAG: response regulator [Polyangiaceae bacterium]
MKVQPISILMADDDEEDRMLTQKAFELNHLGNELRFVEDGEELLDYLYHRGQYAAEGSSPRPGLILLDLNMPRRDGREALEVIKKDPSLRRIPVVVMTTSEADQDIARSYDLGANSYITKPVTFEQLARVIKALDKYWFEIVALPEDDERPSR